MTTLNTLVNYCDTLLDSARFNDYCPNGLQIEGQHDIKKIVTGVTACQALIERAIAAKADAILVHHGYFWKHENPCLVGNKGQRIKTLCQHNISLIAYHLPLDVHPELGNNQQLAKQLNLIVNGILNTGNPPALALQGQPPQPMAGTEFAAHLQTKLGRNPLHIPGKAEKIQRLGWCTGAAQDYIDYAIAAGLDAFLTGEVSERTTHSAREAGIHFFAAGHHATERYGIQALGQHLAQQFNIVHEFVDIDNPV